MLYHWMDYHKSMNVLKDNTLYPNFTHYNELTNEYIKGNSLSRNKNAAKSHGKCIKLELDDDLLRQNYKIIPIDSERAFYISRKILEGEKLDDILKKSIHYSDRKINSKNNEQFMEEFLLGEVSNLDKYIIDIKTDFSTLNERQIYHLEELIEEIKNIVTFKM